MAKNSKSRKIRRGGSGCGAGSAASYAAGLYGTNQVAAPGMGNLITFKTGGNGGHVMKTTPTVVPVASLSKGGSRKKSSRSKRGGSMLVDLAVPAVLLYSQQMVPVGRGARATRLTRRRR